MLSTHLTEQFHCITSNTLVLHFQPSLSILIVFQLHYNIDGDVIYSNEGTTQGDPLAMPFYALSTVPLIRKLPKNNIHTCYADDSRACGEITHLWVWWDEISSLGPSFGYYLFNASKTWLVIKEKHLKSAPLPFANTCVNIATYKRPHLGAAIGSPTYIT